MAMQEDECMIDGDLRDLGDGSWNVVSDYNSESDLSLQDADLSDVRSTSSNRSRSGRKAAASEFLKKERILHNSRLTHLARIGVLGDVKQMDLNYSCIPWNNKSMGPIQALSPMFIDGITLTYDVSAFCFAYKREHPDLQLT